jgi:signal transduction histidine kinase
VLAHTKVRAWDVDPVMLRARAEAADPRSYPALVDAVFSAYAAERGKVRWGDKTPGYVSYLPELARMFPAARFVHLVRDGRDVAASLAEWDWGARTAVSGAFWWAHKVRVGRRDGVRLGPQRYLELRLEDLTADPEATLPELCVFFGEEFAPAMLAYPERMAAAGGPVRRQERHLVRPPTSGLRDWRGRPERPSPGRCGRGVPADARGVRLRDRAAPPLGTDGRARRPGPRLDGHRHPRRPGPSVAADPRVLSRVPLGQEAARNLTSWFGQVAWSEGPMCLLGRSTFRRMGGCRPAGYREPMPGQLREWWRRLPDRGQDLVVGVLVVVGWTAATLAVQLPPVGDGGTLALPMGQNQAAMWATAAVLTLRRMVPPVALLLAVPLYVVVWSLPLYDLGRPGRGGGVLGHATEFHLLPILAVAYLVAQSGAISPLAAGAVCLAATGLLFGDLDDLTLAPGLDWSRVLFALFVVAGTTFLGALVREQRRLRVVESQKVVAEERTRIARELHDVVAHHVSAIVIRAQAAERLAPGRPEVAVDALGWIADAGKEALTGMRHAVQVLRETDRARTVELAPQPTLADLRGTVERLAPVGLDVEIALPDPLPALDPQVELAAVRIAQEGVTNTLRHAEARRAVVHVAQEAGYLVVAVDDDGHSTKTPAPSASGHGLRGMAERAAACGGRLDIARSDLGGWSVRATLPCHQNARP